MRMDRMWKVLLIHRSSGVSFLYEQLVSITDNTPRSRLERVFSMRTAQDLNLAFSHCLGYIYGQNLFQNFQNGLILETFY
jgi:hypothetical protein